MPLQPANDDKMLVIYDGQCPFCKNYVQLNRLRDAAGQIELIDARLQNSATERLRSLGYDLNEGMAVIWAGRVYYGKDAVIFISSMTGNRRWTARLIGVLLRSPARASFFYPILKAGRRLTLKLLGRPPIS